MRGRGGFTLIEVIAVVAVFALVMTLAFTSYVDLRRGSQRAVDATRSGRHAVGVLDRLARDLETSVLLVKPDAVDPLAWPWVFYAESGGGPGADRLRFATRGRRPRASEARASDLEVVTWTLQENADGGAALWRWSSTQLPEALDRSFPSSDAPGSLRVIDGVEHFAVRFQDDDGSWLEAWDSSTLAQSGALPRAAEIELALADPAAAQLDRDGAGDFGAAEPEAERFRRRVTIPVRPLDLAAELEEAGQEASGEDAQGRDEDGEPCFTVGQCLARNDGLLESLDPDVQASILSIQDQCFADWQGALPVDVENCQ